MAAAASHYRVNSQSVINETIDGESVIINLEEGFYYSLDGAGSLLWEGVLQGLSVAQILERAKSAYDGSADAIESGLLGLLGELEKERLVVVVAEGDAAPEGELPPHSGPRAAFVMPILSKFSDMQDLLLLDPIHDVGGQGWPHSKTR